MRAQGDGRGIEATLSWIAALVAAAVALALPFVYLGLQYKALMAGASMRAQVHARDVDQAISAAPDLWRYQAARLAELITLRGEDAASAVRILDERNEVLAVSGRALPWPVLRKTIPIFDSGLAAGHVEVATSLRGVLVGTGAVSILGLLLAAAVFGALRVLPLRALRAAMSDLARERERAEVTLHSIGDAVITTDDRLRVEHLNPLAESMTGWSARQARGEPLERVFCLVEQNEAGAGGNPLGRAIAERNVVNGSEDVALRARDGSVAHVRHTAAPILDRTGAVVGGVLVFHDVSAAREMALRLSWQATHDALTGLANRSQFEGELAVALERGRRDGSSNVLLFIDLDQFKIVNDSCGHAAGDELLRQVAVLLKSRARDTDTLARLGGDEFGLLLKRCGMDCARRVAESLLEAVREFRFHWEGRMFILGASIGIASSDEASTVQSIMSAADAACYSAKDRGRNRAEAYLLADNELAQRREQISWISRLARALDEDRFELHYQLYQSLTDPSQPASMELLVRMIDEDGQTVSPAAFIPAAERYNFMPAIDRWVIKAAFRAYPGLQAAFGESVRCSINLSGASLNSEGLGGFIREQLAQARVPPGAICFEITETAAVSQLAKAREFMQDMRSLGFEFALDDFGSGMSSFHYLKNLPVDYLKIDGNFVREIATDPVSRAMTIAMNQIGHAMGLRTIAEFVESPEVLRQVREIGVDFAQGYAVARPQPLSEAGKARREAQPGVPARPFPTRIPSPHRRRSRAGCSELDLGVARAASPAA